GAPAVYLACEDLRPQGDRGLARRVVDLSGLTGIVNRRNRNQQAWPAALGDAARALAQRDEGAGHGDGEHLAEILAAEHALDAARRRIPVQDQAIPNDAGV